MDLRPYQIDAQNWMLAHRRCIYGDAAGSGKTPTTVATLASRGYWRTLIVAPKSVIPHWEDEIRKWWPGVTVVRWLGPKRSLPEGLTASHHVIITTYETFRSDVEKLGTMGFAAVVFDEAHRLKNRNALVVKKTNRFMTLARPHTVWFLTGTPVVNRPDEAWSLLHLIDRQRFPSYWRWVNEHMEVEHNRWIRPGHDIRIVQGLKQGHEELVRKELAEFLLQRPLDILLPDMPSVTTTVIPVELGSAERKAYAELKKRKWTTIGGAVVQTINEISRMTRYRQIAEGLEELGTSKLDAAVELAADLAPEQVVILTWSKRATEHIAAKFDVPYIHGEVAQDQRTTILEHFAQGKARVLVGTYGTLGEGVDGLQVARHLIQVSQEWTPAKNDQAIARLQRSGQKSAVNVYKLVARDTIDEYIESVLANKRSVIEALRTAQDKEVLDGTDLSAPGTGQLPEEVAERAR